MKLLFIFRILHRSKQATSYLMHWLTPEILLPLTLAFWKPKSCSDSSLPVLEKMVPSIWELWYYVGPWFLLQRDNPVKSHTDNLSINLSSFPPWSLACQTHLSGLFCTDISGSLFTSGVSESCSIDQERKMFPGSCSLLSPHPPDYNLGPRTLIIPHFSPIQTTVHLINYLSR